MKSFVVPMVITENLFSLKCCFLIRGFTNGNVLLEKEKAQESSNPLLEWVVCFLCPSEPPNSDINSGLHYVHWACCSVPMLLTAKMMGTDLHSLCPRCFHESGCLNKACRRIQVSFAEFTSYLLPFPLEHHALSYKTGAKSPNPLCTFISCSGV